MLFVTATARAEPGTILVMGDSLSAGYGMRADQAWPSLLAKRLETEKLPWTIHNASISGETTAGGRARFESALGRYKPRVAVIVLGAYDGLRGLPVASMKENLNAMAGAARQAGARVLLVGMRLPPNLGPVYAGEFQKAFAEVAALQQAALVPFLLEGFADKREYFLADAIHPTPAAQALIVETIWPALRPLLTTARSPR